VASSKPLWAATITVVVFEGAASSYRNPRIWCSGRAPSSARGNVYHLRAYPGVVSPGGSLSSHVTSEPNPIACYTCVRCQNADVTRQLFAHSNDRFWPEADAVRLRLGSWRIGLQRGGGGPLTATKRDRFAVNPAPLKSAMRGMQT